MFNLGWGTQCSHFIPNNGHEPPQFWALKLEGSGRWILTPPSPPHHPPHHHTPTILTSNNIQHLGFLPQLEHLLLCSKLGWWWCGGGGCVWWKDLKKTPNFEHHFKCLYDITKLCFFFQNQHPILNTYFLAHILPLFSRVKKKIFSPKIPWPPPPHHHQA